MSTSTVQVLKNLYFCNLTNSQHVNNIVTNTYTVTPEGSTTSIGYLYDTITYENETFTNSSGTKTYYYQVHSFNMLINYKGFDSTVPTEYSNFIWSVSYNQTLYSADNPKPYTTKGVEVTLNGAPNSASFFSIVYQPVSDTQLNLLVQNYI
jgi:hypothetical protein